MHFDVFTLFPGVIQPYLDSSILQRAKENGLIQVALHNIRDWTSDRHHVTDDAPYGGGGGMVLVPFFMGWTKRFNRRKRFQIVGCLS